jgi:uncharacterized protein involved in response to NO
MVLLTIGIISALVISLLVGTTLYLPGKDVVNFTKHRHSFKIVLASHEKRILKLTTVLAPVIFVVEVILFLVFKLLAA